MVRRILCVLALVCATVQQVTAQTQDRTQSVVETLRTAQTSNWLLQVESRAGWQIQGRVADIDSSTVRFGVIRIPLDSIAALRRGVRTGHAPLIVAGTTGLVFGLLAAITVGRCDESCNSGRGISAFGLGGAIG